MSNLANITFSGGSSAQKDLITQVHIKSIGIAQSAQRAAQGGGDKFVQWFGSSPSNVVSNNYFNIYQILNIQTFAYDIADMLNYQFESEMIFCLYDLSNNIRTIKPWKGIFLQDKSETIILPGALSLIYLVFEGENTIGLETVRDKDSAMFLAKYNPQQSVLSPRNYMYFAETIAGE